MEVIHPNWPTMWPRMLTDGKTIVSFINYVGLWSYTYALG